ncbi:MAG: GNAT family protein [Fusobacteria bacterium]|nr:GNAT family protein [Fusobacteriota bacterium]
MITSDIILRDITLDDLDSFYTLNHPSRKFHELNGPYFKKRSEEELKEYCKSLKSKILYKDSALYTHSQLIALKDSNQIIGQVSFYWVSKETYWLDIGIVIFDENFWGKGVGEMALKLWINNVFITHSEIIRLGLTTWSGNLGMMKLAEKLGFQLEARIRKARIVNGEYFDSVSYGILREEWTL